MVEGRKGGRGEEGREVRRKGGREEEGREVQRNRLWPIPLCSGV